MISPIAFASDFAFRLWNAKPPGRLIGKVQFTRYHDWFMGGPPPFSLSLENRTKQQIELDRSSHLYAHSYIELTGAALTPPPLWMGLSGRMHVELSDTYPGIRRLLVGPVLYFDDEADAVEVSLIAKKIMDEQSHGRFSPDTLATLFSYGIDY